MIENEIHVDLNKSISQLASIFIINVKFVNFNFIVIKVDAHLIRYKI